MLRLLAILLITPPNQNYEEARSSLDTATVEFIDRTPEQAVTELRAALDAIAQHPRELLADPDAPQKLARGRLTLAWALLAAGDPTSATDVMDLAIRSAGTMELPLSGLGPNIRKLHDERRAVLEAGGHARISVDCDGCEIAIDETKATNPSAALLLGTHRVWLFDPEGELEPRFEEVTLDTAEQVVQLEYRAVVAAEPIEPTPELTPAPVDTPTKPTREHARWPKLVGMGVGAGLLIAGGILLSFDRKCHGGGKPTADNIDTCPDVWRSLTPSAALLGVGGGVLLGASIWLGVDEARAKQPRVSAMLGWTLRF